MILLISSSNFSKQWGEISMSFILLLTESDTMWSAMKNCLVKSINKPDSRPPLTQMPKPWGESADRDMLTVRTGMLFIRLTGGRGSWARGTCLPGAAAPAGWWLLSIRITCSGEMLAPCASCWPCDGGCLERGWRTGGDWLAARALIGLQQTRVRNQDNEFTEWVFHVHDVQEEFVFRSASKIVLVQCTIWNTWIRISTVISVVQESGQIVERLIKGT